MLKPLLDRSAALGRELLDDLKQLLSPAVCIDCEGDLPEDDHIFCKSCLKSLRAKNKGFGPVCPFCGLSISSEKKCEYCSMSPPIHYYYWGRYDEEMVEHISIFKFRGVQELGLRLTDEAMLKLAGSLKANNYDYVIPVPLHKSRRRKREYNQSEIIARRVSKAIDVQLAPESVFRVRSTRQQSKIDSEEKRWRNVKDAFSLAESSRIDFRGRRILVVDDIVTTGATIFEACRPILEQNPRLLDVFSIAYAG